MAIASDVDLAKIYANLNFDMLASPNYVRFVYDGDASADPSATAGPPGSARSQCWGDRAARERDLPTRVSAGSVQSWPVHRWRTID
ncbi:hypothetical protein [Cryobacterium sp. Hz9]|uniref:hypothetical protein n=1 Tax=Cryobacterium sp. Hz9 TaxID=1259167 RepID=UPI0018E0B0E7|nr:hypothetical protein [Cryobacterium sp. Hz9]